ncbi:MAG: DUF4294 domain-containing protein [Bacteroidia bacterium]
MRSSLFILLLSLCFTSFAQTEDEIKVPASKGIVLPALVVGTDTFAYVGLPIVTIETQMSFKTRRQYAQWTRLKYNVKKVYPYAIVASARLKEYEQILDKMPNDAMRKAYMKEAEKKLEKEFGDQLKSLTITQGRILIKLIDRETGHSSYELVKQLRGNFSAFMWQSLASLFGSSLKTEYDGNGEDQMIELAIKQIEAGEF